MPIYIKYEGVEGRVDPKAATGGVWRTTNFLTRDAASSGPGGGPRVNLLSGSNGSGLVQISRISLSPGVGGVEGRDPSARLKVEQMINSARSRGTGGKLYLATDAGVYQHGDAHGKLLVGNDQGVWRSSGANRLNHSNNLKQIGLAALNSTSVEIIVTDPRGNVVNSHRLRNVNVTGSSGTFTLTFNGQTTGG